MLGDLLGTHTHGHKKHGHSDHWSSGREDREGHHSRHSRHFPIDMALGVLRAVAQNRILLVGLVLSVLVALALGVWILVTLLAHSGPIVDFISRNGIKGVVDTALALGQKLWEGTGR